MLKLAGFKKKEEPIEEEPSVEEAPIEEELAEELPLEDELPAMSMGLVSPKAARYMTPDMRCGSCMHFDGTGSCEIVSGEIDPEGTCMLYNPGSSEEEVDLGDLEDMPEATEVMPVDESEEL